MAYIDRYMLMAHHNWYIEIPLTVYMYVGILQGDGWTVCKIYMKDQVSFNITHTHSTRFFLHTFKYPSPGTYKPPHMNRHSPKDEKQKISKIRERKAAEACGCETINYLWEYRCLIFLLRIRWWSMAFILSCHDDNFFLL